MGRTKRKRNRKTISGKNLDSEDTIICLRKWMTNQGWQNQTSLQLHEFAITGRGISSTKNIARGATLIKVPFKLLITLNSIQESELLDILSLSTEKQLSIQDLLVLFLILERNKGCDSKWRAYIESLPQQSPWLPFKLSDIDIKALPFHIRETIRRSRWNMNESWKRLRKSINSYEHKRCVLDVNSFTWAFTMVNTRAVYVDPQIIHNLSELSDRDLRRVLSDEPCMALCPFLDMFNHSADAKTVAELKHGNNGWYYELRTLCGYKKYEQIFISYGSHDNLKLFCEYGFFIPWKNMLDTVKFSIDEVLNVLGKQISNKNMHFLQERKIDRNLYIGFDGLSFNLKALFYFVLQFDVNVWTTCVFTESYSEEVLNQFQLFAFNVLQHKLLCVQRSLFKIENNKKCDNINLINYLKYYVDLIMHFCKLYNKINT